MSDNLAEAKLSAATLVERTTYAERVRDARARDLESLAAQSAEATAQLRVKTVSAARIEPVLALFEELARSAQRWTQSLEEQATAAQNSSTGLHASVTEARARAHEAHALFDGTSERLSEARVQKGRLELQVEAAVNHIAHDCGTPLETALAMPPLENRPEVEAELFRLNRRIANLGTINPDAAEEYDELKVRYDYLADQLDDLDQARKSLAKINRVIDARMKDDFIRTYEAVDKNFQEIFATLFPGGKANLSLVDPDDLENTGVEVNAQPKGKRIAKMMLLSGGEKSLTALALLFASRRFLSPLMRATRMKNLAVSDDIQEALECVREVRATNQEERYLDGIRAHIDEAEAQTVKGELATGICVNGAQIVLRLGIATTVLAGAAFVLEGTCGFMTLFCFLLVVSRIYAPFDQCLMLIAELFAAKTASARMRSFYDEPLANGGETYAPQGHDVVFDDVSFSYGDGEQVLSHVGFTAREGEVTALVGPSGSGKSTCARLAARLWDATSGRVSVGGVDVATVDPEVLLRDFSVVFQDVLLFDDTVMGNIRLGRAGATDEEVLAAARAAMSFLKWTTD